MVIKSLSALAAVIVFLLSCSMLVAAEINLPASGQSVSYGTGDDGAVKAGLPWPSPRFTAANGTVVDNLTGLVWLQNANCTETVGGVNKSYGYLTWANALTWSANLASGMCGLMDGSSAGQWRLPTRKELQTLLDSSQQSPALPTGHQFSNLQVNYYWSSSTYLASTGDAWYISLLDGTVYNIAKSSNNVYVLPVRGGQ